MSNLVTFEQAKDLQQIGYNEMSNSGYVGYTKSGELVSRYQYSQDKEYQTIPCWIKAPTISEALDFIREEKGIVCDIDVIPSCQHPYQGKFVRKGASLARYVNDLYSSYEMAESALLTAVLNYLMKK